MDKYIMGNNGTGLPEWLCTFFVDENDEVLLPCGAFGDELQAVLCLGYDNQSFVRDGDHAYAPARWLAGNYPNHAEKIKIIAISAERRIKTKNTT